MTYEKLEVLISEAKNIDELEEAGLQVLTAISQNKIGIKNYRNFCLAIAARANAFYFEYRESEGQTRLAGDAKELQIRYEGYAVIATLILVIPYQPTW